MWKRMFVGLLILIAVLALVLSHWRGRSLIFTTAFGVPMAQYDLDVETDIPVTLSDGVILATDIYRPKGADRPPTILMRTPYGKTTPSTMPFALAFARRGYIVVTQDVRGTFQSTGEFVPLLNERRDGAETVAWIEEQDWFDGRLGLFGLSYIGFTANAIAVDNPPSVKAVFAPVTTRSFYPVFYDTGGFNLDAALNWAVIVHRQENEAAEGPSILERIMSRGGQEPVNYDTLPISQADRAATGKIVDFYQTFVTETDENADYWQASSLSEADIAGIEAPIYLASGWYDAVLPRVLDDYRTLEAAGRSPYLVIGDGPHVDTAAILRYLKHSIAWFDHHLKGEPLNLPDTQVQIRRMGDKAWLGLDKWPSEAGVQDYFLGLDGALATNQDNLQNGRLGYTYDPANPTPALGGPLLSTTKPVVDNASLEERADTLVFTSKPLLERMDIVGAPKASVFISSSQPSFDVFVRLSRVNEKGVSTNITDAIRRIQTDPNSNHPVEVELELWPTAIRLSEGERLRVLIASGAHPRLARNLGHGDLASQVVSDEFFSSEITLHLGPNHRSAVSIPTFSTP